jgi:hypothetical protein
LAGEREKILDLPNQFVEGVVRMEKEKQVKKKAMEG